MKLVGDSESNPLGLSGRPARCNSLEYKDPKPYDPELALYQGVLLRRPNKVNKFDFRPKQSTVEYISDDQYKKLRKPPYRASTSIGVALLSAIPKEKQICIDPKRIENIKRPEKTALVQKKPFGLMNNCIGKAISTTAMAKANIRHNTTYNPNSELIADDYGNKFNNGRPLKVYDFQALALEQNSRQTIEAGIQLAIAAKKQREEEELKAQKAAKSKEEAASKAKEEAAADAGANAEDGSESESSEKLDEDLQAKQIQKTLFDYVQNNKHRNVDDMFSQGVDVNTRDQNGNTTLHIACQNGAKKMIKTCLKHGANLNAQNHQGQTPIHYCFAYQYDKIASFLISKGANDLITNEFGLTCYEGLKPPDTDLKERH